MTDWRDTSLAAVTDFHMQLLLVNFCHPLKMINRRSRPPGFHLRHWESRRILFSFSHKARSDYNQHSQSVVHLLSIQQDVGKLEGKRSKTNKFILRLAKKKN